MMRGVRHAGVVARGAHLKPRVVAGADEVRLGRARPVPLERPRRARHTRARVRRGDQAGGAEHAVGGLVWRVAVRHAVGAGDAPRRVAKGERLDAPVLGDAGLPRQPRGARVGGRPPHEADRGEVQVRAGAALLDPKEGSQIREGAKAWSQIREPNQPKRKPKREPKSTSKEAYGEGRSALPDASVSSIRVGGVAARASLRVT